MAINYSKAIKKSLYFCIQPKRWIPVFLINFVMFLIVYSAFQIGLGGESIIASGWTLMLTVFFGVLLLGSVLTSIWITGAVVYQSYKEKEFEKSFRISCSRYSDLFLVLFATTILSLIAAIFIIIPLIGILLSSILIVVIYLSFFFVIQEVIINKKQWVVAIKNSYALFRENILLLVLLAIITELISVLIALPFQIPGALYSSEIAGSLASSSNFFGISLFSKFSVVEKISEPLFFILMIIYMIGSSVATVFSLKIKTEFYLQMKKRFFRL